MIKAFEQFGFSIETTGDLSPTLRISNQGESMHHFGGAATETQYIYGETIEQAHKISRASLASTHKIAVVGLGLGYIEIAWAISMLKNKITPSENISFDSFEVVPELIENFKQWLHTAESVPIYDLIVEKMTTEFSLLEIKITLQNALKNGSALHGNLIQNQKPQFKWNLICYDAFSQKTNEVLWSAEFLNSFLKNHAASDCVFSTYACTSFLKKALAENEFQFFKRPGFKGKRDATLALRGLFKRESVQSFFQTF